MELTTLGWGPALKKAFEEVREALGDPSLRPGRIIRQESLVRVAIGDGAPLAKPSGRLLREAKGAQELPAIGDWVAVSAPPGGEGVGLIQAVLPRRTALVRQQPDSDHEGQVIAANIDVAFIVSGLDAALNLRRIERMLTLVGQSGARPVLVLTKADLAPDLPADLQALSTIAPGVETLAVSVKERTGLAEFCATLREGQTGVLLGLSGVGKSTLMNELLGEEKLATFEVREDDRRGRHTTTHRQLFVLPQGGMLIDSPGMREFGLFGEDTSLKDAFGDIDTLSGQCRFSDCGHQNEPGCAVQEALRTGALDEARYESFLKLQREQKALSRRTDPAARREQRRTERLRSTAAAKNRGVKKGR